MAKKTDIEAAAMDALIEEVKASAAEQRGGPDPSAVLEEFTAGAHKVEVHNAFRDDDSDQIVTVYSTKDNVTSKVILSHLSKRLRQRWPQSSDVPEELWGRPVFSLSPKGLFPQEDRQKLKCRLHRDHADRAALDALGLQGRQCRKANLSSEMDVYRHMKSRHKDEQAVIDRAEDKLREERAQEAQLKLLEAVASLAERNG